MSVNMQATAVSRAVEEEQAEQLAFFESVWLPNAPLAAPAKTGPYRRTTRLKALGMPMIEANPTCLQSLVIADVDTTDIRGLAEDMGLPAPTFYVGRKADVVTGHITYALKNPVCLTNAASRKPVNLLARIETGICDVLGADIGYAGRITKNPITPGDHQYALFAENYPTYSLHQLAAPLDKIGALPTFNDPRPRQNSGIGRNVDIFNRTRTWGYRAIKRYWDDDINTWFEVVHAHATAYNLDLEKENRIPLPTNEITHLSRSIATWIWKRFNPQTFTMIQAARGRKTTPERARKAGLARAQQRTKNATSQAVSAGAIKL
ncbi:hypothetical protein GSS88_00020 [Corynebacterium sp. 3HC-13]|uniref:replication initiation protein n=1 Tax=Corynebacterium poyangense TaxID=2684405 RepID=UPI001CCDE3F7|nr:replication initiation protein [Corynebacterium poyangense]MBZ8176195.1 hypothetical protein [Corynebacterium poyangense]